jgi:hypothetical protein
MRRIFLVVLCLLLAFYVGWPIWSALQLRSALKSEDAATVARKIDFPSVRASMRPAIEERAGHVFDTYARQLGPGGALIVSQLKPQLLPKLVENALDTLVTPQNVIRIANDQGTFKERIERVLREQLGKVGNLPVSSRGDGGAIPGVRLPAGVGQLGLPGLQSPVTSSAPAAPSTPTATQPRREFGISNIKSFAFSGPLSFEVGLAKEAAATSPDIVARMGFSGLDWRLNGLVPKLERSPPDLGQLRRPNAH